jgi:hypothetical protein
VHLCQRAGARPDLVGDDLVVDLLAEFDQFGGGTALDEASAFCFPSATSSLFSLPVSWNLAWA